MINAIELNFDKKTSKEDIFKILYRCYKYVQNKCVIGFDVCPDADWSKMYMCAVLSYLTKTERGLDAACLEELDLKLSVMGI